MERGRFQLIRKLSAFILTAAILISLSGCVRYSTNASVSADGKVDFAIVYAVMDLSDYSDDSSDDTKEMREALEKAGWEVRDYQDSAVDETYVGFTATKKDIDISDLENELHNKDLREAGLDFDSFSLKEKDGVYTLDWNASNFASSLDGSGATASDLISYGGYMKFVLDLPCAPISHNAHNTESEDTRLEWDLLNLHGPIQVEFSLKGAVKVFPISTIVTVQSDKTADVFMLFDEEDEDLIELLEDADWEIEEDSGFTASKSDIDLEDLEYELTETGLGYETFSFRQKDKNYILKWAAPEEEADFILELPNEPEDHNATSEKDNGKSLVWDLAEMDKPLSAKFQIKDSTPWILIIGLIAGGIILAGAIVVVIVLILRKKKSQQPAPAYASPAPQNAQQNIPIPKDTSSYQKFPSTPMQMPPLPSPYSSGNGQNPGLPPIGPSASQNTDQNKM